MTIKHVIFDLDGVLVDAKEIHQNAFLEALKIGAGLTLTPEFHQSHLCGLPTKVKLARLGIPEHKWKEINELKQSQTIKAFEQIQPDLQLQVLIDKLLIRGITVSCCSNSIRQTVRIALERLGIYRKFHHYIGNDEVCYPKPSPEMYYKSLAIIGIKINEALVIEDSVVGQQAIRNSGIKGLIVKNREDLTIDKVLYEIEQ